MLNFKQLIKMIVCGREGCARAQSSDLVVCKFWKFQGWNIFLWWTNRARIRCLSLV